MFASLAFATVVYSVVCSRVPLSTLLWCATLVNVFPAFLFLFVTGAPYAVAASAVAGLCTGIGTVAFVDLLTRSCPRNLEGTANMLGLSCLGLAWTAGDIIGARVFADGGFALCVVLEAVATAAIVPFVLRLPSNLIAHADGDGLTAEPTLEMQAG